MIVKQYKNRKLYVPTKGYVTLKRLLQILAKNDGISIYNGDKDVTKKVLAEAIKHLDLSEQELLDIIRVKILNS